MIKFFNLTTLSICSSLLELIMSPRKEIYSFLIYAGSIEINLLDIIQSPRELFFEQRAKKMGLMSAPLVDIRSTNLSKAFLIFSMIYSYSLIISNASVNSLEKNFERTSREFSF
jgi:hypothetical protein